jgi:Uncharacterized conserved protein
MAIFGNSIPKVMDLVEAIGYMAAIITTAGFVPQTVKAIKTRQTKDISLWMYIILLVGVVLWLLYGIFTNSWPIILANSVTILLVIPVLVLKIKC